MTPSFTDALVLAAPGAPLLGALLLAVAGLALLGALAWALLIGR